MEWLLPLNGGCRAALRLPPNGEAMEGVVPWNVVPWKEPGAWASAYGSPVEGALKLPSSQSPVRQAGWKPIRLGSKPEGSAEDEAMLLTAAL